MPSGKDTARNCSCKLITIRSSELEQQQASLLLTIGQAVIDVYSSEGEGSEAEGEGRTALASISNNNMST